MEIAVPIARYFAFVGSVLVALLLVANWMWPSAAPVEALGTSAQGSADVPIARIRSTQKWPDKVQFDTSMPTIVLPSAPAPEVAATVPPPPATEVAAASPLDARAEAKPNVQPAPPRKRMARAHHRSSPRQQAPSRWADANPMARPWSWSWNW
jgi:hypothetical protein